MYRTTKLKSGLRIVSHDMKDRDSVALGFLIGSGGRYEDDRIKGAAHFLEHILFKGSKKYGCTQIKEEIEGVGGTLNAFTSEERTCYYAKIPARNFSKTFDILSDMVLFPLIRPKDIAKERGVIVEEIKMYYDLPQYYVLDLLEGLLWPNHPLGKNLAGTTESVSRMTGSDLQLFHSRHYAMGNLVVSACGNIHHRDVLRLVEQKFRQASEGSSTAFIAADNSQSVSRHAFARRPIEQMHLALGVLGLPEDHPDKYAAMLLHVILGGNMSSRLFNEVREKRGLAYSISTSLKALKDTGMFMVRAGVDNKKIVDATALILKELDKIKRNGVTHSEFTRAKDYYLGQVLLGLEDTLDHMLYLGDSLISRNRLQTLSDIVKKVKQVTPSDIKRLAKEIFQPGRYNLSVVGHLTDEQEKDLSSLLEN